MRRTDALWLALLLAPAVLAVPAARAEQDSKVQDRIEELEERIDELESEREPSGGPYGGGAAGFLRGVSLSGSANAGYFGGEEHNVFDESFQIWDARFFVEAELGSDVEVGDTYLLSDVGFLFEWDLVRLGELENRVGELYVDLQHVLDSNWLNVQVGRFQLPVGENYLRFSKGYRDNPFVSNTVGGPWFWDEGVRLYGGTSCWGYVASVTNGETSFNVDENGDKQLTLKLWTEPVSWLHLSASVARSGELGSSSRPASGALWLGEAWARAFGSRTDVPSFDHGVAVPDGPNTLDDTIFVGVDAIVSLPDRFRLWLAYGEYDIDSDGPALYDRRLRYWLAELILEGAWVSETLRPLYLGVRANGLGTYDRDEGYLLDSRLIDSLGYNARSLETYSIVLGWRITRFAALRAEYSFVDIDLVRGVTAAIREAARSVNSFAVEAAIQF